MALEESIDGARFALLRKKEKRLRGHLKKSFKYLKNVQEEEIVILWGAVSARR